MREDSLPMPVQFLPMIGTADGTMQCPVNVLEDYASSLLGPSRQRSSRLSR